MFKPVVLIFSKMHSGYSTVSFELQFWRNDCQPLSNKQIYFTESTHNFTKRVQIKLSESEARYLGTI